MSVSYRYANALYKAGMEKGVLEQIEKDFTWLMNAYKEENELKKVFESPLIEAKEKKEFIKAILKERQKELVNFLMLLIDRKREKELSFIYESFMDITRKEHNRVLCKAVTVYELSNEEKNKLISTLKEITNKEVELQNIVNKTIIGGIVVRVGDKVYDYSVKGQLNELKDNLLKTSLAKVG